MNLPEGFTLARRWSGGVVGELIADLAWSRPTVRVYGVEHVVPREVCVMGRAYGYSGSTSTTIVAPLLVSVLRDRLEREHGLVFNSCLANLYRDGSHRIGWHADDERCLGEDPVIASVSFGSTRTFRVRHNLSRQTWDIPLADGDLLIMGAGVQRAYKHAIHATKAAVGPRVNLTFRRVV